MTATRHSVPKKTTAEKIRREHAVGNLQQMTPYTSVPMKVAAEAMIKPGTKDENNPERPCSPKCCATQYKCVVANPASANRIMDEFKFELGANFESAGEAAYGFVESLAI